MVSGRDHPASIKASAAKHELLLLSARMAVWKNDKYPE
jgi:hypothetical protein